MLKTLLILLVCLALAAAILILWYMAVRFGGTQPAPVTVQPDWDAASLEEARSDGDPFTRDLFASDLVPPLLFDELTRLHPVPMDVPAADFSQAWALAGERIRQLGDTQQMQAVSA